MWFCPELGQFWRGICPEDERISSCAHTSFRWDSLDDDDIDTDADAASGDGDGDGDGDGYGDGDGDGD